MPLVYFLLGVAVGTVGVQKIIDIATNYINHLGQHITRIGNNVYQITTTNDFNFTFGICKKYPN